MEGKEKSGIIVGLADAVAYAVRAIRCSGVSCEVTQPVKEGE